ncbi:acyclic terpene utilization AtuA family protein [Maricaulis sp.]|uniref:acyclic terpene utilization AtuA family protein n=1 Tax=Maricaulis sp. TaxID=1486257 RepID=UPI0026049A39|nr:acyclic terpene utilization AtuA family protein [Maricaulis sp.]
MTAKDTIRIGGASGFWGESDMALPQFLAAGGVDYIVFDYLAEITLSIMARARAKDPGEGYAPDFVDFVLKPHLAKIASQGVKIISNAGGMNPRACGAAVEAAISEAGLDLKVAVVTGDDLMARAGELAAAGHVEMFTGAPFPGPASVASINAYLGAAPVAEALRRGADIVITGRGVDSAVTLGACLHAFDWSLQDWDRLAAASLAGHVIECGPQATGGNFTDWEGLADGLLDIGYPIAEISADGSVVITKPAETGGAVTPATVGEQILYEISDPGAYVLPDVVCDFTKVELKQAGKDRVVISGTRGRPAPDHLKVSVTFQDGWRAGSTFFYVGDGAARAARCFAETALARARRKLKAFGAPDYSETLIEVVGDGSAFGESLTRPDAKDVAVKLAVKHADALAAGLILRESIGLALAAPPGLSGFSGNRPKPSPVVRLFSFLLPRDQAQPVVHIGSDMIALESGDGSPVHPGDSPSFEPAAPDQAGTVELPLHRLAWARSGDKGDKANIGVLPRDPALAPWIWAALDEQTLRRRFSHYLEGDVDRYFMPGISAMNIVLHDVLGGGGVASLRNDPQGKAYAQILLQTPVTVPAELAEASS